MSLQTGVQKLYLKTKWNMKVEKCGLYHIMESITHVRRPRLRVVFDCASACDGTSLNKELLQGPDSTNTLLGVLLQFHQGPIAFMTNIEGMFHQVKVANEDVNCLRFLWWPDGDIIKDLVEHRMTVHISGAESSPSCATFALLKTADDNQNENHLCINTSQTCVL